MDRQADRPTDIGIPRPRIAAEIGGACGDLGTLLPYAIGAVTVAGLAPFGVLFGFGVALIGSGLFYGLPMAVQPMKLVGAILLTGELGAPEIAATGLVIGAVMLVLGLSGAIGPLARLIPSSVTAGLQLGLGLIMAALGLGLLAQTWWLGLGSLALLLVLMRVPLVPAAPVMLLGAMAVGYGAGLTSLPDAVAFGWSWPVFALPDLAAVWRGFEHAVLPQLPLTLTNAVVVTAVLARHLFPHAAGRASERNLALTTGIGNLALAPFGALPMCHGAGGIQAQHRFGARSGLAPILLGAALLVLAFGFAGSAPALLALIPSPAVGALLVVAGVDLAVSKRLFDARRDCWPAIGLTALLTLLVNPSLALLAGVALETARGPALRWLKRRWEIRRG